MSLTASKKLNLTNNYIRVYTGCTSLLTDHTAYSQIHHDDAICKHVESPHNVFPVVKECKWVINNAPWFQIKESLKVFGNTY